MARGKTVSLMQGSNDVSLMSGRDSWVQDREEGLIDALGVGHTGPRRNNRN